MKLSIFIFLLILSVFFGSLSIVYSQQYPVVSTDYGDVRGVEIEGKTNGFFGIPFAQPPINDLRFAAPKPPEPWDPEELDGTKFKPACMQNGFLPPGVSLSEDCLYLNVYVPKGESKPLPVMVYIHGGRYWTGRSWENPGEHIAAQGPVIVVTIAYRLNTFGFFAADSLRDQGASNVAIQDQQAALIWINENIHSFGGDPSKINVFGESAGAGSILIHLFSSSSFGLFNNAILQSTWQWILPSFDQGRSASQQLASSVGCSNTSDSDMVSCLRSKPAQDLLVSIDESDYFQPQVDGVILEDLPIDLLHKGKFNHDVAVMIGNTADEGNFMAHTRSGFTQPSDGMSNETFVSITSAALEPFYSNDQIRDILKRYRFARRRLGNWFAAAKFFGEFYLYCGGYAAARAFDRYSSKPVYTFIFDHVSENAPKPFLDAGHGNELEYVFNGTVYNEFEFTEKDFELSKRIMNAWTHFATSNDPASESANTEDWEPYNRFNPKAYILEQPPQGRYVRYGGNLLCSMWNRRFSD